MSQMYSITVQATAEVRDKEGNLIENPTVEFEEQVVTREQLLEMGLEPPEEKP